MDDADRRRDPAARLLDWLRKEARAPALSYAELPARMTGGFDTSIYSLRLAGAPPELSGPLVLRVFREDDDQQRAPFETAVQNAVSVLGYPAPRVLHASTDTAVFGAAFMLMQRLAGRPMLHAFLRPSRHWLRLPRVMAEGHLRLHALDPQPVASVIRELGYPGCGKASGSLADAQFHIERSSLESLRPALDWLVANEPPPQHAAVICHGDFHPLNLLVSGPALTGVIDWAHVAVADPVWDVGASIALFTQGPLNVPLPLRPLVKGARRLLIERYLRAYQRERPLSRKAVEYYEALRCLGFLIEAEERRLAIGRGETPSKPGIWTAPHVLAGIVARFRALTGVTPALPR